MKKTALLIILFSAAFFSGCVKNEIDLNKLSGDVSLNPSVVIAAIKGEVTLGDIIEPDDTLVIDQDNSVKLVFRKDSVIDFQLEDFYSSFPSTGIDRSFLLLGLDLENISETIIVDPGEDIKLKEMAVINGEVEYNITSGCQFDTEIHLLFPSINSGVDPLVQVIAVASGETVSGVIDFSGYMIDFTSDPSNPYNRVPVTYSIYTTGPPSFSPDDIIDISLSFNEPEFDFMRGYFGMNETVSAELETLDTSIDFFSGLTGSLYLSNPLISVNYTNSFGMPLRVVADVAGENSDEIIYLNFDPVDLDYPVSENNREVSSFFNIDKENSNLPGLVSMLPDQIIFGGTATSNPLGETGGDNIIFSDSHFNAGIEVVVPFEFRTSNLQFSDTTDNFLLDDNNESSLDQLSRLTIDFFINNGFPLGGDITVALYDSLSATIIEQVSTSNLFEPADVDITGRVIEPKESKSLLKLTPDFIAAVEDADKVIISFTLYTTGNGLTDVKVYSDYSISFRAALSLQASIKLD